MTRAALGVVAAAMLLTACGKEDGNGTAAPGPTESNISAASAAPDKDLAGVLGSDPRFAGLVKAAGMDGILSGKEPYTILAPSKEALDALPPGTLDRLSKPEGRAELTALLRSHILPGTILAADLERAVESGKGKAAIATMAGEVLSVSKDGTGLRVTGASGTGARIVGTEQPARNGVVHMIDGVLGAGGAT